MTKPKVLPLFPLPTRNDLRDAVAQIIRDLQRELDLTDDDVANAVDVTGQTIANARNKKCDLNSLTIARIGAAWGEHFTDPYHALYGACSQRKSVAFAPDPMPAMLALAHKISACGGLRNHQELLAARSEIEAAYSQLAALRCHVMELAA